MANLFSDYIQCGGILFKHARGISDRSGKEFHIFHEIILFLDGDGEFISENTHMQLKPATIIFIPKETFHQLVIHGDPECYYRCILQFDELCDFAPLTKDMPQNILISETDQEIRYLFDTLISATKAEESCALLVLKSVLVLLLNALVAKSNITCADYSQNPTIQLAVKYINQHLNQQLPLPKIAQYCNLSVSALSHIFKKEMYCSVHRFIVNKRLIHAYHKICAGEAPTVAAVESGFSDYSGFYRQYKKAFGFPPSKKHTCDY